jgi:hypothetical protein
VLVLSFFYLRGAIGRPQRLPMRLWMRSFVLILIPAPQNRHLMVWWLNGASVISSIHHTVDTFKTGFVRVTRSIKKGRLSYSSFQVEPTPAGGTITA